MEREVLTKQKAIENHRLMWNKIAELLETDEELRKCKNIDIVKVEAIRQLWGYSRFSPQYPRFGCFCCEYASPPYDIEPRGEIDCTICPILWSEADRELRCFDDGAVFSEVGNAMELRQYEYAIKCAREIAELPERKYE